MYTHITYIDNVYLVKNKILFSYFKRLRSVSLKTVDLFYHLRILDFVYFCFYFC